MLAEEEAGRVLCSRDSGGASQEPGVVSWHSSGWPWAHPAGGAGCPVSQRDRLPEQAAEPFFAEESLTSHQLAPALLGPHTRGEPHHRRHQSG